MQLAEVMESLKQMGTEQTRKTFLRHGAPDNLFGVKVGDLKKLVKDVKKDQALALALYDTGNSDAMYLAGLTVNPATIDPDTLRRWAKQAGWYMIAEYSVAGVAAESPYALELAREWMQAEDEIVATCGWSTYGNYVSITPDDKLDMDEIRGLLRQVEQTIHRERNRVRYVMNGFVIAVGAYVPALLEEAERVAAAIGKVDVNVGQTACKVPLASEYIDKIEAAGKVGVKRKTCIC